MPVSSNTSFLPQPTRTAEALRLAYRDLGEPEIEASRLQATLRLVVDALIQEVEYSQRLRLAIDDALRSVHQRIDQRAATGPLADRPDPAPNGIMYLSTDETPEVLYIADNDTWHGVNTDS